jgi:hypothetical protein
MLWLYPIVTVTGKLRPFKARPPSPGAGRRGGSWSASISSPRSQLYSEEGLPIGEVGAELVDAALVLAVWAFAMELTLSGEHISTARSIADEELGF